MIECVVAAGLLYADGALDAPLLLDDAIGRLRRLLSPAALWTARTLPASWLDTQGEPTGDLPLWLAPPRGSIGHEASTLLKAWREALPLPASTSDRSSVLRLQVVDERSALRLSRLAKVSGYEIVPSVAGRSGASFSWRWPLRIGIVDGPRGKHWREQLEASHYEAMYDVSSVSQHHAEPYDIVLIDADSDAAIPPQATCVIALGEKGSLVDRLARGREDAAEASIVISAATADVDWFEMAVREMVNDQPIDVAMHIAPPKMLISADAQSLPWTSLRQWSYGLARQLRGNVDEAAAYEAMLEESPQYETNNGGVDTESNWATAVAQTVKELDEHGFDTVLKPPALLPLDGMAIPGAPEAESPVASPRVLIADAYVDGRVLRKALLPDTEHSLQVRIAIPGRRETAAQAAFDESDLPANSSVTLQVYVTCDELNLQLQHQIVLSTADRKKSSTIAVFKFHTGGDGTTVNLKILVTHQERPLQEAYYEAAVRGVPVRDDRVGLTAVLLSSASEPDPTATPAQVSLEVDGANLRRSGSLSAVDVSATAGIQEAFEFPASKVLGRQDAPETLDDNKGKELLISLARAGALFKTKIRALEIEDDASTISLLVDASTPLLPLELIYDAPTPRKNARICEYRETCLTKRTADMTDSMVDVCPRADTGVVCPYAFWGQRRVIARTVRLGAQLRKPKGLMRKPLGSIPLSLRPVLYAAAARADNDTSAQVTKKPSQALEDVLIELASGTKVTRVHDWETWKSKVDGSPPQLMVVLAHTEYRDRVVGLEIGKEEWLDSPDIAAGYIVSGNAPPPLVVLMGCSTARVNDCFGGLPAAFVANGAGAVVVTLTSLRGPHGARAAAVVIQSLYDAREKGECRLGTVMTRARRRLIEQGQLSGLLLLSHGEIDLLIKNED
jgi:hypothetical protein